MSISSIRLSFSLLPSRARMSPACTTSSGPGDTVATSPGPALARLMAMVVRPKRARRPISRSVLPKNYGGAGASTIEKSPDSSM